MTQELGDIIRRAARGEQDAYRGLYRRFRPAVVRVAEGFGGLEPDEVEDVVQDAFVHAFRALPRLKYPEAFSRWLLTITRHQALARTQTARTRSRLSEELEYTQEVVAPPLPAALAVERRAAVVRDLIHALPEGPEKQTVRLFYLEGELSAREIAERLGLGKSAVTMRLERFRARVKRELLQRLLTSELE